MAIDKAIEGLIYLLQLKRQTFEAIFTGSLI